MTFFTTKVAIVDIISVIIFLPLTAWVLHHIKRAVFKHPPPSRCLPEDCRSAYSERNFAKLVAVFLVGMLLSDLLRCLHGFLLRTLDPLLGYKLAQLTPPRNDLFYDPLSWTGNEAFRYKMVMRMGYAVELSGLTRMTFIFAVGCHQVHALDRKTGCWTWLFVALISFALLCNLNYFCGMFHNLFSKVDNVLILLVGCIIFVLVYDKERSKKHAMTQAQLWTTKATLGFLAIFLIQHAVILAISFSAPAIAFSVPAISFPALTSPNEDDSDRLMLLRLLFYVMNLTDWLYPLSFMFFSVGPKQLDKRIFRSLNRSCYVGEPVAFTRGRSQQTPAFPPSNSILDAIYQHQKVKHQDDTVIFSIGETDDGEVNVALNTTNV